VFSATAPVSTTPYAPQPKSLPRAIVPDGTGFASAATASAATAGYDVPLLIVALEEIDARRLAIEWLVEAGLLGACLG
jgi:hypothetical protein